MPGATGGRSGAGTGQGLIAALGLYSGDSRVFSQSSGTRDSPADASRAGERLCSGLVLSKAAPTPGAGRATAVQLPHLCMGLWPLPCRTRTLPWASSSSVLQIITSFVLLLSLLLQSPLQLWLGAQRGLTLHQPSSASRCCCLQLAA